MTQTLWTSLVFTVLFAYSWLGYKVTHTELPSTTSPAILYATEARQDLQVTFSQAIDEAKKSICLAIYSLSDTKVINALRRASERGVEVQVVCDQTASSGIANKLGSGIKTTYRKSKGLMHLKILVIDRKVSYCGSANLTTGSLKRHSNLVSGIQSRPLASYLIKKIENLNSEGLVHPLKNETFSLPSQKIEMWTFPDNAHGEMRVKKLIQEAKKSVQVAMFTWTRFDLADEIVKAQKRGIKVEVVIDRNSSTNVSKKVAEKLLKAGVKVRVNQGQELLHHKCLIIDHKTLLNGSANWTKAAFTNNDDCFLIITPLNNAQKLTLRKMWKEMIMNSSLFEGDR